MGASEACFRSGEGESPMTFFLAILAALGAFIASNVVLGIVTGIIGGFGQFFHLLVFVPPYRTIIRALVFLTSAWVGFEVFNAVS